MYGRWMEGKAAKGIAAELASLASDHPDWEPIGVAGVHIAIQRYAKRAGKPLPPRKRKRTK
jgi:hypothetical protein